MYTRSYPYFIRIEPTPYIPWFVELIPSYQVRAAYCKKDFEWDNLKRLAAKVKHSRLDAPTYSYNLNYILALTVHNLQMVDDSNTKLMRDYVVETTPVPKEE